jgi:hypothetical protein
MPVERFRSIAEMNAAPIRAGQQSAFDRFIRHCARYRLISPRKYTPGVFRFRTLEEAQASREEKDR